MGDSGRAEVRYRGVVRRVIGLDRAGQRQRVRAEIENLNIGNDGPDRRTGRLGERRFVARWRVDEYARRWIVDLLLGDDDRDGAGAARLVRRLEYAHRRRVRRGRDCCDGECQRSRARQNCQTYGSPHGPFLRDVASGACSDANSARELYREIRMAAGQPRTIARWTRGPSVSSTRARAGSRSSTSAW